MILQTKFEAKLNTIQQNSNSSRQNLTKTTKSNEINQNQIKLEKEKKDNF